MKYCQYHKYYTEILDKMMLEIAKPIVTVCLDNPVRATVCVKWSAETKEYFGIKPEFYEVVNGISVYGECDPLFIDNPRNRKALAKRLSATVLPKVPEWMRAWAFEEIVKKTQKAKLPIKKVSKIK